MQGQKMTVWSTRYAMTQGIVKRDVIECLDHTGKPYPNGMVEVLRKESNVDDEYGVYTPCITHYLHGLGKDYHLTQKDAILRTLQVAKKNRQALQKKINKLDDQVTKWCEELNKLSQPHSGASMMVYTAREQIVDQVRSQVFEKVRTQTWAQVEAQVVFQVLASANDQVRGQVAAQVAAHMKEPA